MRHIKRFNRELAFYIKVNHNITRVPYVLYIFIYRTPLVRNEVAYLVILVIGAWVTLYEDS